MNHLEFFRFLGRCCFFRFAGLTGGVLSIRFNASSKIIG